MAPEFGWCKKVRRRPLEIVVALRVLTRVARYARTNVCPDMSSSRHRIAIRQAAAIKLSISGLADLQPLTPSVELQAYVLTRAQVGGAT